MMLSCSLLLSETEPSGDVMWRVIFFAMRKILLVTASGR
jgi:hypothetical protein